MSCAAGTLPVVLCIASILDLTEVATEVSLSRIVVERGTSATKDEPAHYFQYGRCIAALRACVQDAFATWDMDAAYEYPSRQSRLKSH